MVWWNIVLKVDRTNLTSFKKWCIDIFMHDKNLNDSDMSLLMWTLWMIWKSRNDFIFNHTQPNPMYVLECAKKRTNEFLVVHSSKEPATEEIQNQNRKRWTAPRENWVKVNCDGSFDQKSKNAAIGIVCRNNRGEFLWGFGEKVIVKSVFIAELLALRKAFILLEELQVSKAIVETDNKELCDCINSNNAFCGEWEGCLILQDLRDQLASNMNWCVSFSYREGNCAADFVAGSVRKEVYPMGWVLVPTPPLVDIMSKDAVSGIEIDADGESSPEDREGIG